jgi:hypothetical protein
MYDHDNYEFVWKTNRRGRKSNKYRGQAGSGVQHGVVLFNSGNYAENFSNAEAYMRQVAAEERRLVAGFGLSDGTFAVLPTEGYLYKNRRKTKQYGVNKDRADAIYTNMVKSKGSGESFKVKINGNWLGVDNYLIAIPDVYKYYIYDNSPGPDGRHGKHWNLPPGKDWQNAGRSMGANNLILFLDQNLG